MATPRRSVVWTATGARLTSSQSPEPSEANQRNREVTAWIPGSPRPRSSGSGPGMTKVKSAAPLFVIPGPAGERSETEETLGSMP
jgi:hypothetical protein